MSAYGPYSPIKQAGNFYFISGQVGINPETKQAAADVVSQTNQALANLARQLSQNKLAMDDVAKTTIYLKNIGDFTAMNDIYVKTFNEPRPARSCVEVSSLPKLANQELLIEIEAVAYKADG